MQIYISRKEIQIETIIFNSVTHSKADLVFDYLFQVAFSQQQIVNFFAHGRDPTLHS